MLRWHGEGVRVLAVDLPSGLSSDTGRAFEPSVVADVTVTFGAQKLGLAPEPGATLAGRIAVADIGLAELTPSTWLLEPSDGPRFLPVRRSDTNKGTYGHLLVVAGSRGESGAAALAGLAALRGGGGLGAGAPPGGPPAHGQGQAPELAGGARPPAAVLGPTHLDALLAAAEGKDALVIGPGIPRGPDTHLLLGELLTRLDVPVLIDADGLNALAGHPEPLQRARAPVVLTPHPGEMARLSGKSVAEIQADRVGTARGFARAQRAVLVLQGGRTLVPDPRGAR